MKKFALILFLASAFTPLCLAQAQLAGEWNGTLQAGGQSFHIVWHVTAAADGTPTSTIDNVDEGIIGIKVKTTTVKDSTVTLNVDDMVQINGQDVHIVGVSTGTLNKDATEFTGTWTQTDPAQPPADVVLKHAPAPAAPAAAQPGIAGDWQGALNVGSGQLRLVLHIAAAKDGTLTATLDSVDQSINAIPVNTVTLQDAKLNLTVDTVKGTYQGTVNKDASEIDGTWSQGQPLELIFKRAAAPVAAKPAPPSDIDGTWQGTLDAGATKLRILFKVVNTADGLTAQMQSPDQSPLWLTASSVIRTGSALSIGLKGISGSYDGKLSADLSSIDGTFTQGPNTLPLVVTRDKP